MIERARELMCLPNLGCVPFSKSEVQLDLFSKALGEREPILFKINDWKNDEVITFHSIKVNRG